MPDGKEMAAPKLTLQELVRLLETEFPEAAHAVGDYLIEEVWHGGVRVRRRHHEQSLRPGGTVSGPIMMALADFTMYLAVLSAIGWVPLAVTTNLTINFLKKPGPRDLLAEARLFKLGRRLAVGEVALRSDGSDDLVAHVTSTYSIPV
ncbi:MAG: PaaI family thioesterase [Xanthobacteraceae bacterium]